jgi:hypothetical protein
MATGPRLDGAGQAKMVTLNDALAQLQSVHAVVERMAMEVRNSKPVAPLLPQLKRTAQPLVGMLKAQFGLLSDQVAGMLLVATRGGGDQVKVRGLREQVGQLRQALEVQVTLTKNKHTVDEGKEQAAE